MATPSLLPTTRGEPYQYFWYSPWGEVLEDQHSSKGAYDSPFRFNGKEWDEETGNYYYGARDYDPNVSVWLSVDPMSSERPSLTPYNFVSNNPVMRIDPTGMLDDDITVNSEGKITDVVETDQPNRFFDEDGNELVLNDPENADSHLLNGNFEKGEQLFYTVPVREYAETVQDAGINEDRGIGPALETVKGSYGKGDFAHDYLAKDYRINTGGTDGERPFRSAYPDQAGYFKFEGSNTIYNLYDGGNHMWGTWMRLNGYSEGAALGGANWNEFGNDTPADQRSIRNGYNYGR